MSRMRTVQGVVGAALLALLLTGCIGFTVQKDVDGDPKDDNGPWIVTITCDNTDPASQQLVFTGEGIQATNQFDALGPFPTTVTCLVHETKDGDADDVDVECVEPLPPDTTCTQNGDRKLTVVVSNVDDGTDITINVKVTNTYDPPTTSTSTTTTTAPAPPPTASAAVAASPSFTG
jgi:hypothetical protein